MNNIEKIQIDVQISLKNPEHIQLKANEVIHQIPEVGLNFFGWKKISGLKKRNVFSHQLNKRYRILFIRMPRRKSKCWVLHHDEYERTISNLKK